MPIIPRQLGIGSLISEALESTFSTATVGPVGTTTTTTQAPVQPTTTAVSVIVPVIETSSVVSLTSSVASTSTLTSTSETPTVSVIVLTTTTTSSTPLTTQAATSSETPSLSSSATSAVASLTLTTPVASTPQVSTSTAPTTTRVVSPSVSATGSAANSGSNAQDSDSNMSNGIIALIAVGAVLAALLAGAFAFRRIQVYRRARRRENKFGAGDNAPFPFTNVSEADLKGAQPIGDLGRQGSVARPMVEKPLPSIVPDVYPGTMNAGFGYPAYGDNGMTGPYPAMGPAAGYGYGQTGRTPSPAPSQVPRMMSPAPRMISPAPPPAAYVPAASAPYPNSYPQAPTPAPSLPAPVAPLAPVSQVTSKKRVIQTFQPTLPDELDIREGDLVTILHAYDDGWGLCESNGRRGVVPLECLDPGKPDLRASRRLSSLSAVRQ